MTPSFLFSFNDGSRGSLNYEGALKKQTTSLTSSLHCQTPKNRDISKNNFWHGKKSHQFAENTMTSINVYQIVILTCSRVGLNVLSLMHNYFKRYT